MNRRINLIKKEPPVMKAIQWTGDNPDEVLAFLGESNFVVTVQHDSRLLVQSMSRKYRHLVRQNRFIVKDYQKLSVLTPSEMLDKFFVIDDVIIDTASNPKEEFFKSAYQLLTQGE